VRLLESCGRKRGADGASEEYCPGAQHGLRVPCDLVFYKSPLFGSGGIDIFRAIIARTLRQLARSAKGQSRRFSAIDPWRQRAVEKQKNSDFRLLGQFTV
jgi:hypothetical protein